MLVYTRCGIERESGGGEGPGRTEEDIRKCFFYFFIFYFLFLVYIYISFLFLCFSFFLLHEDQSPGSIHSRHTDVGS